MPYAPRALVLVAFFLLCGGPVEGPDTREFQPTVILVSLDGFGVRFLEFDETPTLVRLAANGVRAVEGMVSVFPTKTFPNHYSIVTGLYPEHHGIVANNMYDPVLDATFRLSNPADARDARWWGGEPLWVTAEQQGQVAASFFWVGSEAPISGVHPTFWKVYDGSVPNADRVQQVLEWLDLPDGQRPTFITLYFSDVDTWVHRYGTDAPEMRTALRNVDGAVSQLIAGIEERDLTGYVNVVVVADHGMANTSPDSVIFLDDYIDLSTLRVADWTPVAALWPDDNDQAAIYQALRSGHSRWQVYRKAEIPERFHYREHRRIAPIIAIADEGWSIGSRSSFDANRYRGATHGYDNQLLSMRALFIAQGPAFRSGLTVEPFQSIHLYELLCAVLGLTPAPNDGSLDSVRVMLRTTARDG